MGFGDTAHNEVKYSLDEQVKLIDDFMNEMGIGKIAIVGHGLGALVGMNFALRYKNSVDRVMAINDGKVLAIGTPDEVRSNPTVQRAYLGIAA